MQGSYQLNPGRSYTEPVVAMLRTACLEGAFKTWASFVASVCMLLYLAMSLYVLEPGAGTGCRKLCVAIGGDGHSLSAEARVYPLLQTPRFV